VATGAWRADTTFTLTAADKVGGAGSLQYRPAGTTLSLNDLVALMLTEGDNTAANLVLARLGGVAAVNDYLARLGLRGTTLRRPLDDTAARAAGIENTTTAGDLARLLLLLDRGQVASPAHSARLLSLLGDPARRDPAWLFTAVPPGTGTAHLTGQWPDFRGDAGILRVGGHRYALALLVQDGDGAAMERGIAALAAATYGALLAR
jgi:beta-lactamase class A